MNRIFFFRLLLLHGMLLSLCGPAGAQEGSFDAYEEVLPGTGQAIRMVPVPGGIFRMGSPVAEPGRRSDEGPLREVRIAPFWMADREITWDLYQLFIDRNIDALATEAGRGDEVDIPVDAVSGATQPYIDMSFGMGTQGYPATSMTQLAASRFCQWLSALTGHFYRLPTEAEWEYACRAGSGEAYTFGPDTTGLDTYAWYAANSKGQYQPVGQKAPNAWGLYDMHGNVAEWTLDQYDEEGYPASGGSSVEDPYVIPVTRYPRTVRGGSWQDPAACLRCAARRPSDKSWKRRDPQLPKSKWWHTDAPFLGFRIVRPLETPSPEERATYWE